MPERKAGTGPRAAGTHGQDQGGRGARGGFGSNTWEAHNRSQSAQTRERALGFSKNAEQALGRAQRHMPSKQQARHSEDPFRMKLCKCARASWMHLPKEGRPSGRVCPWQGARADRRRKRLRRASGPPRAETWLKGREALAAQQEPLRGWKALFCLILPTGLKWGLVFHFTGR